MSCGILRYPAALLFVALLVASCGGEGQQGTRTPPRQPDSAGTTSPGGVAGTDGLAEDAGGESSWSREGGESGGSEGAANEIREVEFDYLGGYERARIAFGEGEASGGIPRWSVEKAPEGGLVRLYLPGVTSTQTAGEDLAGLAADAYYVVRRPNGDGLFVDFLALTAFEYRVTELAEAGQLAVDFRPAPGGLTCPAVQGEDVVVVQPCEAEEAVAGEPLAVEGYSRDPGGSLSVVLHSEEGKPIASETVRTEYVDAWGYFESSVTAPPSYEGLATVRVRDQEPDDGVSTGAEVPVFFGVGVED
ncbi:MAG: Gmad2 immunoglobulin-like domain-containing protein [Actinomycetota bacterium]|nr:Gmad2 immunoglobulin-like domain-containing protein [Actinomycetota bacterium]